MDIPWKVGMLHTAHKELITCVVILLLSCNDASGPPSLSYCHHTKMHMGPLAVIEYLGQSKEISEKLGESKDKCEPIFMAIREYAINVRVIIP